MNAADRTLGIDLSTETTNTGICVIHWAEGRARVEFPEAMFSPRALSEAIAEGGWVAIDAPFGWPQDFVEAVRRWSTKSTWTTVASKRLRLRATDRVLAEHGYNPLSVTSDRIAATARYAAKLLADAYSLKGLAVERVCGPIVEAYPVVALNEWGLRHDRRKKFRATKDKSPSYKQAKGSEERERIVRALGNKTCEWLDIGDASRRCGERDHDLDALLCALVARAASKGLTVMPEAEPLLAPRDRRLVSAEGWIHRPLPDSLEKLP
jgi:predicted nuclease with RNAse H fold